MVLLRKFQILVSHFGPMFVKKYILQEKPHFRDEFYAKFSCLFNLLFKDFDRFLTIFGQRVIQEPPNLDLFHFILPSSEFI